MLCDEYMLWDRVHGVCVCDTPVCDDVPSTNTRGNRVLLKAASEKREEEENKEFSFFAPNSPK